MPSLAPTDPILASFAQVAAAISEQFGANCQASVYDLRHHPGRLVSVSGPLVPHEVGAPLPNEVHRQITMARRAGRNRQVYASKTEHGLRLSSSVTLLHDAERNLAGCLCVDLCIENLINSIDVLQNFCNHAGPASNDPPQDSVIDLVDDIVTQALRARATPPSGDRKPERLKIVARLDQRGIFLVKGAVELVARRLNISKFTLYSYIEQTRRDAPPARGDAGKAARPKT